MGHFRVTYEIVTPESAEHGDVEECGFTAGEDEPVTLRDALQATGHHYSREYGAGFENVGSWFSSHPEQNYCTGAETTYDIHPPRNITPASYARLSRVLTGR